MVRKKDQFWEYVKMQNGRSLCNFCQCDFTGGISRIKSHLAGVQCRGIKICSNVPEDVKIAALQAIDDLKKKTKITASSSNVVETATVSCSASSLVKGATHAYPVATNISDELDAQVQLVPLDVMPFYDTSCASTLIHNILRECSDVKWIYDMTELGNFIGTFIYMHDVKLSPRMEYKVSKEYSDEFVTQCANDFLMLQSVMEVENELQALQLPLASTYCTRRPIPDEDMEKYDEYIQVFNRIVQRSEFWRAGKEVVHVLQPLYQVLHLVDGYRSISGYFYEALKRAQVKIKEGLNKNQEVWHIFEGYRTKIVHPIHAAAAFLNPTYMFSENFEEDIEIKEGINYILEKLVASEDKEAFVTQMLRYRSKEPRTFTTTAKIMLRTSHPRMWWDYCGDHLPVLRKYAIRIMSQLCTAPSCKQHRLQPEMPDCNDATSMEKYMTSGAQYEESIDLHKLACPEEFRDEVFEDFAYENWHYIWSGGSDPEEYMRIIDRLVIK